MVAASSPFAHRRATISPNARTRGLFARARMINSVTRSPNNLSSDHWFTMNLAKSFFGYDSNILILQSGGRHIHAGRLQSFFKSFKVFRGCNDDGTFARLEATTNESHQRVQQHAIVFVEWSYVFRRSDLAPEYVKCHLTEE
jgi:hypothetical protein